MSTYLYPDLKSKKAYKDAIANGHIIRAEDNTPWGTVPIFNGTVTFEGPHYPKPHKYYGKATVVDGKVIKVV